MWNNLLIGTRQIVPMQETGSLWLRIGLVAHLRTFAGRTIDRAPPR